MKKFHCLKKVVITGLIMTNQFPPCRESAGFMSSMSPLATIDRN